VSIKVNGNLDNFCVMFLKNNQIIEKILFLLKRAYKHLFFQRNTYDNASNIFLMYLVGITRNNLIYEYMLKKYDHKFETFDDHRVKFVLSGHGAGSLNIYRIIKVKSHLNTYFEKPYIKTSNEYQKIIFFYNNIYPDFIKQTHFVVPKLELVKQGNRLNFVYYRFLNLEKINKRKRFELLLHYYCQYSSLFYPNYDNLFRNNELFLFTQETRYVNLRNGCVRYLKKKYPLMNIEEFIQNIEQKLINTQHIFQHGDLHYGNVFKNCIIDWDTSGFYPMGYDLGFIIASEIAKLNISDTNINDFILTHSKNIIDQRYMFSVKYFTMISLTDKKISKVKSIFQELIPNPE